MVRRKAKVTKGLTNPKSKVYLTLSPEAQEVMNNISKEMGLTNSALIERLLEGSLSLSNHNISASSQEAKSTTETEENLTNNAQELDEYKHKISLLEKELEHQKNLLAKQEEINTSIQAELNSKLSAIKTLEAQVQNSQGSSPQDNSEAQIAQLQQIIQEKEEAIASLQTKINHLEKELSNREQLGAKPQENHNLIQQLKTQLEEKNRIIKTLENKVNQTTSSNYISHQLTALNEQQKQTIISLEKRISELETVASIGQQTLNKWRSKIF